MVRLATIQGKKIVEITVRFPEKENDCTFGYIDYNPRSKNC